MKIITIIHNQFSFLFEDDSLLLPIDGIQSDYRNPTENEIRADWGLPPIEEQENVIPNLPLTDIDWGINGWDIRQSDTVDESELSDKGLN